MDCNRESQPQAQKPNQVLLLKEEKRYLLWSSLYSWHTPSNPVCNSSFSWSSQLTCPFNTAVCTLEGEKNHLFHQKEMGSWIRACKLACFLLMKYNYQNYNKITHTLHFGAWEDTPLSQRTVWKNTQQPKACLHPGFLLTTQDISIAKAKAAAASFYVYKDPECSCTSNHFTGRKPFTIFLQVLTLQPQPTCSPLFFCFQILVLWAKLGRLSCICPWPCQSVAWVWVLSCSHVSSNRAFLKTASIASLSTGRSITSKPGSYIMNIVFFVKSSPAYIARTLAHNPPSCHNCGYE